MFPIVSWDYSLQPPRGPRALGGVRLDGLIKDHLQGVLTAPGIQVEAVSDELTGGGAQDLAVDLRNHQAGEARW